MPGPEFLVFGLTATFQQTALCTCTGQGFTGGTAGISARTLNLCIRNDSVGTLGESHNWIVSESDASYCLPQMTSAATH